LAEQGVQIKGCAMDCGHVLQEERPEETIADLTAFLFA
jgi:haloacetate dehalogenase